MSVLDRIRGGTDSFAIQFVLVIVVVTFVFWGVGGQGAPVQDIAIVDGHRITDADLSQAMRRAAAQQRDLDEEGMAALRVQTLNELIEGHLVLREAERYGLHVAPDEIHMVIATNDAFRDEQGKFSASIYESSLKRMGWSRHTYEDLIRDSLLRQKVFDLVSRAVTVDPSLVHDAWVKDNTTVSLIVVKVPDAAFYGDVPLDQAQVDAMVAAAGDSIKSQYEALFDRRFNEPRKATLRTILLRNDIPGVDDATLKARAEAIRAELVAGADFAATALRWSEDLSAVNGGQLGTQDEDQLDPAIALAVFALQSGDLSPVVATSRGYQILLVEEIIPAKVTSLEEASPILAKEMIQAKESPALATAFAEQLLATWKAEGSLPQALVDSKGLLAETVTDLRLSDEEIRGLGESGEILRDAAALGGPGVLGRVYTVDGQRVVVQVSGRQDPDPAKYEQDKALLTQRLLTQERQAFSQAWIDDLVAQATIKR